MTGDLTARASPRIAAPVERVWRALTDPAEIRKYYFGTDLKTDWKVGSPITWSGEWQGKPYQDKGRILEFEPNRRMKYSHFSPMMGKPDTPENYHDITIDVAPDGDGTRVSLAQEGSADEKTRDHSQQNWTMMLDGLRKLLEG
jgi:uncharacterized protein YndB with AHSA1/START domain